MKYIKKGINLPKAKKLLIIFTAAALISGSAAVLTQIAAVGIFGWKSTVYREEYSLPFKSYLNINVTNIPLYIDIHDGDEIIILYKNETALIIEENDYSCTISQDADFAFSLYSLDLLDYSLRIMLPDKVYREVTISSASGNVEFLKAYALSLNINSRSGDIAVTEAVGNMRLKNRYGNITADFIEYRENCFLESESGSVTVTMPRDRLIKLEFLTESGSFTSDFFKKEYKNRAGNFFTVNGENAKILSVTTSSGNLYLSASES